MSNIFVHGGQPRKIQPRMDAISTLAKKHWELAKAKNPEARFEDSLKAVASAEPQLWDAHVHGVTTDL